MLLSFKHDGSIFLFLIGELYCFVASFQCLSWNLQVRCRPSHRLHGAGVHWSGSALTRWGKYPAKDPYVRRGFPNKHLEKYLNETIDAFHGRGPHLRPSVILDNHRPQGILEESKFPALYVQRPLSDMRGDSWQPVPADNTLDMKTFAHYVDLAVNCSHQMVTRSHEQAKRERWDRPETFAQYEDGVRLLPKHIREESDPRNVGRELPLCTWPTRIEANFFNRRPMNTTINDNMPYEGFTAPLPPPPKEVPMEERDTTVPIGRPRRPIRKQLDYYKRDNFQWFRGSRKCAQAWVRIAEGKGRVIINRRRAGDYFRHNFIFLTCALLPGEVLKIGDKLDVFAKARGGGLGGQAEAVGLGLARAIAHTYPEHEPTLRGYGHLKVDVRQVERKKPGRKKARKGYVWVKR